MAKSNPWILIHQIYCEEISKICIFGKNVFVDLRLKHFIIETQGHVSNMT